MSVKFSAPSNTNGIQRGVKLVVDQEQQWKSNPVNVRPPTAPNASLNLPVLS